MATGYDKISTNMETAIIYCGFFIEQESGRRKTIFMNMVQKRRKQEELRMRKNIKTGKRRKVTMGLIAMLAAAMLSGCSIKEILGDHSDEISNDPSKDGKIAEESLSGNVKTTMDGKIVDPDGKVIPGYSQYYVDRSEGYIMELCEDSYVLDCYRPDSNGKIIYDPPVNSEEYDASGIEALWRYATMANCDTNIEALDSDGSVTRIEDDGDYFDEVVLRAWFDENGNPIGSLLPEPLSEAAWNVCGHCVKTEDLIFIDNYLCTIDQIKRTSPNNNTMYAFVLKDIVKRGSSNDDVDLVGREYTSGNYLVVHGGFDKILNGDDLLVFACFSGLASDDTPNFRGIYIQIINDRYIY